MDYNALLDICTDLGYRLAMCGAETFRVEESINLVMKAYGIEAEVFAIPNNLTVSIKTPEGLSLTRMRRIGMHGNDLDSVERYTNLSRRVCAEKPTLQSFQQWLKETDTSRVHYGNLFLLIGHFLGSAGFSVFFGGTFRDFVFAGICGLIVGLIGILMDRLNANQFFRTITAAFLMSLPAYALATFGIVQNADTVIIGALMLLVPGLLFTNAMRDIIYGDTNSGINRIVQVFLIAVAIALGTAVAWSFVDKLLGTPATLAELDHNAFIQLTSCLVGSLGFMILFNVHGKGGILCVFGGIIAWSAYLLTFHFTSDDLIAYFVAAAVASLYSEIMARIRKYPAISYLVISIFPLIPGASIYYTMNFAVQDKMSQFADKGMHTIGIAGAIAVGILSISTLFKMWTTWKRNRIKK